MTTAFLTTADIEERNFGSSLDPLLHGVAQGLANLFPPIETARRSDFEDEAGNPHEVEDEHPVE